MSEHTVAVLDSKSSENAIAETGEFKGDTFWRHYWTSNVPLKFIDCVRHWGPCCQWTPEYLQQKIGSYRVKVARSDAGVFDYNNSSKDKPAFEKMIVSELIERIYGDPSTHYYLHQTSIWTCFKPLINEVIINNGVANQKQMRAINLWFGSSGCFSPLHFDRADNFLLQVYGRKQLTLFKPSDSKFLYPNVGASLPHCSRVDLLNVDENEFPLFHNAEAINLSLNPGDIIFIPKGWWHAVRSIDVSISINFWWMTRYRSLRRPLLALYHGWLR